MVRLAYDPDFKPKYTFHECCVAVIKGCPNEYAVGYAKAGLTMLLHSEERATQALYIKGNLSHWRSAIATDIRYALDHYSEMRSSDA